MQCQKGQARAIEIRLEAAPQHAWSVLAVSEAGAWLRPTGGAVLALCAAVGNPHPFPVRAPAGGMRGAWSGGGTDTVE